jgi:hypothetical protein
MTHGLPPEDLATIAAAPPTATAAELARALGRPYGSVHHALSRMRHAGGWFSPVSETPCTECGGPVTGPPGSRAHVACRPARGARQKRERRAWLTGASLSGTEQWGPPEPTAAAARRARERAHALRYYHALPEDRRAALAARWTETGRRDYERTRRTARRHKDTWTEEDDRYVLDHLNTAARAVGLALGRTTWAVRRRRWHLRRSRRAGPWPSPSTT